jgi:translation initiation factor IF-3
VLWKEAYARLMIHSWAKSHEKYLFFVMNAYVHTCERFFMEVRYIKNFSRAKPIKQVDPVNEYIESDQVLVIDDQGEKLGILNTKTAIKMAFERELDLVVVSPGSKPPVAKFMDYSKYRYEQQRKAKEMKKKTQAVELKEIRLSPTIDKHDLETKKSHCVKFLQKGHKVKLSIRFFGRMITHIEIGKNVMNHFLEMIQDVGSPDGKPSMDGRSLIVIVSPNKTKGD